LVRSINTSIVALLPVAAILFVGAGLLGAGTLKDLALVLFIGMAVGTYSSVFVATPVLCDLKEREPAMKALAQRVMKRRAARGETPAAAADEAAEVAATAVASGGITPTVERRHRQTQSASGRAQPKRQSRSQRRNT
jgi:preprotein translocase subunit SecF